jgi:hypothetical protein
MYVTHFSRFTSDSKALSSPSWSTPVNNSVSAFKRSSRLSQLYSDSFLLIYPKRKKSLGARSGMQAGCDRRSALEASLHLWAWFELSRRPLSTWINPPFNVFRRVRDPTFWMKQGITASVKNAVLCIVNFVGRTTAGSPLNPVPLHPIFSCDGATHLPMSSFSSPALASVQNRHWFFWGQTLLSFPAPFRPYPTVINKIESLSIVLIQLRLLIFKYLRFSH